MVDRNTLKCVSINHSTSKLCAHAINSVGQSNLSLRRYRRYLLLVNLTSAEEVQCNAV